MRTLWIGDFRLQVLTPFCDPLWMRFLHKEPGFATQSGQTCASRDKAHIAEFKKISPSSSPLLYIEDSPQLLFTGQEFRI